MKSIERESNLHELRRGRLFLRTEERAVTLRDTMTFHERALRPDAAVLHLRKNQLLKNCSAIFPLRPLCCLSKAISNKKQATSKSETFAVVHFFWRILGVGI